MRIFIGYLIFMNVFTFFVFGTDKQRAKRHIRRVPARVLFLLALAGGSAGAQMGMLCFRHKTKHTHFVIGIPAIFTIQLVLFFLLFNTILLQ